MNRVSQIRSLLLASAAMALLPMAACGTKQPPQAQHILQEPHSEIIPTPSLQAGQEDKQRINSPLTLADLHQKYRSTFLFNGPNNIRQAALTFDDVPDTAYTLQILDILKKHGVKATFFIVGNRAEAHPEVIQRMVREGHELGNHSYSHPNLAKTDDTRFHEEVLRTEQILKGITGYTSKIFRPPYGNITEPQILWLASQQYHIINWNVDSLDWKGLSADQVMANVLGHVGPGAVILQHGAGGEGESLEGTVQALPTIIAQLQASQLQLVTVSELFQISSKMVDSPATPDLSN